MGRLEVACRRFALLSGIQQEPGDYAVCVQPQGTGAGAGRKGTLALITEPAGEHPSLAIEACKLAQRVVTETYFADHSFSLTGSLLNALEQANNALLQYNYAPEAQKTGTDDAAGGAGISVQSNGPKTRRAKVGMTALLLRPDGAGMYLSQMSPTQAYVLHNGLLTAIPEPAAWHTPVGRTVVTLRRVPDRHEDDQEGDWEDTGEELPTTAMPAPSLGSGPGVEADLVYRRVAPGDMVVLVSSSLARHIERDWAEQTFARHDADGVIDALYEIATEQGLAQAHACVLELGVAKSSGVEQQSAAAKQAAPQALSQVAGDGGVSAPSHPHILQDAQRAVVPALMEALKGPRDWFSKRKSEPAQPTAPAQTNTEYAILDTADGQHDEEATEIRSRLPTQLFVQHTLEAPPYHGQPPHPVETEAANAAPEDEELQFNGWEDAPPALDDPKYDGTHRIVFKPKAYSAEATDDNPPATELPIAPLHSTSSAPRYAIRNTQYAISKPLAQARNAVGAKIAQFDVKRAASKTLAWTANAAKAFMPEHIARRPIRVEDDKQGMVLPLRFVIGAALLLAAVLLLFSVIGMAGSGQKRVTQNLLGEAQQLETAANQPGLIDADRQQKLQLALDKAKEAGKADPRSQEAQLLVAKVQGELDQAQGVTRLGNVKLLIDFDAIDKAGAATGPATSAGGAAVQPPVSSTVPLVLNDILVQSNDAYILDRATNRVYRCQVAATTCAVALSEGDSVGGAKVGKLSAMMLRVGSPVVLDDNLVAYVFSADTSAWQAQQLGGAGDLQKPKDFASYDGNLYTLGSKPGQISKYASGQYGQAPVDWIKDGPSLEAMKNPVAMAIDGAIYVALADGKILVLQAGKVTQTFTPKTIAGQPAPTRLFTNTDVHDLYIFRSQDGSITRISKDSGQTVATYKPPVDAGITALSGMTVDESRGKAYLVQGRKVYEATLGAKRTATAPNQTAPNTQPQGQPAVRPTAVP